jgi:hypothetical protein
VGLLVFSQSPGLSLDVPVWDVQAQRFFGARLTHAGVSGAGVVRVRVAPAQGAAGERTVSARARTTDDLRLADDAEARRGGGLGLLAHRCPTVLTVVREEEDDRLALLLAAVLASIGLGPIVDPRGPDIFGVKTARAKLEE